MLRLTIRFVALAILLGALPLSAGWDEGVAAFKNKDFDSAAQEFQTLVEARPDAAPAHYMLGLSLQQLERKEESLHHLRKAYDLDPSSTDYALGLGQALMTTGAPSEAAGVLGSIDRSSLSGPRGSRYDRTVSATVKALLVQARKSTSSDQKATYAAAAAAAAPLVAAYPSYANRMVLGQLQIGAGRYAEAQATMEQIIAEKNDEWLVFFYLGVTRSYQGLYERADTALRGARQLVPADADQRALWRQTGFVKEKLGDYRAAIDAYRRAGDAESVTRVERNQRVGSENQAIEAENVRIREMQAEAEDLERQLDELERQPPPDP